MIKQIWHLLLQLRLRVHSWFTLIRVSKHGKSDVFGKVTIINPQNFSIGNRCSLNHGAYINAFNPISFGDDVTVSAGAKIISTGIDYLKWAQGNKAHEIGNGIIIGNHVWIGADAVILNNVTISGKYVVVAAGAIVTKNIDEDYVIVAGCPAKIVKRFKTTP